MNSNTDTSDGGVVGDLPCLQLICGNCNNVKESGYEYATKRVELTSFLRTSCEGRMILFHYEKHGSLSKLKQEALCNLLIDRELLILLDREHASLANPLKKVTIPAIILTELAKEVARCFKEKEELWYVASCTTEAGSAPPSGKLLGRLNYKRSCMQTDGIAIARASKNPPVPSDSVEQQIKELQGESPPEDLDKLWTNTIGVRHELAKTQIKGPLWHFEEFPCMRSEYGRKLIELDFATSFPQNTVNIKDTWSVVKQGYIALIKSKDFTGEEEKLVATLDSLPDDQQDAAILTLLPWAIKAGQAKPNPPKRQRTDSIVLQDSKKAIRDTFLLHINADDEIEETLRKRLDESLNEAELRAQKYPLLVFVGKLTSPHKIFCAVGDVKYEVDTVIDALYLCFKIYTCYNFSFPKAVQHLWLILQKSLFGLPHHRSKSYLTVTKVLTFLEKELGRPF